MWDNIGIYKYWKVSLLCFTLQLISVWNVFSQTKEWSIVREVHQQELAYYNVKHTFFVQQLKGRFHMGYGYKVFLHIHVYLPALP